MNLLESMRVAIRGLASNKMRTGLTMLGIIIGVGVVILVVAIGEGATQRVTETVNSLGTNLLTVFAQQSRVRINAVSKTADAGTSNRMTLDDATEIGEHFPKTVEAIAPNVGGGVQIRLGNRDSTS